MLLSFKDVLSCDLFPQVYVVPDDQMLKFTFKESPGEVQGHVGQFVSDLESAVEVPVVVNLLGTQYLARSDGTLDTTRSS
jgi:hypothetical protein